MTIKSRLYYVFAITLLLFSISVASFFIVVNKFEDFAEVKIGNSMKEADLVQLLLNENYTLMLRTNEILLVAHGMDIGHETSSLSAMATSMDKIVDHTTDLGTHIEYCQVLYNKEKTQTSF